MQIVRLKKIALVSALLTLGVFSLIIWLLGGSSELLLNSLLKGGVALTFTGMFWTAYDRLLWRYRFFRLFGWLSPLPDLNGRWEGTVERLDDSEPHDFVLEIKQSFTAMSFKTFSAHSRGASEHAWLNGHTDGVTFEAGAVWRTTTLRRNDRNAEETFSGTSLWQIAFHDEPGDFNDRLSIVDHYYTSRVPATTGTVKVRRVSRQLKNRF